MSTLKKHYNDIVKQKIAEKYQYSNTMQVPKLVKVVINRGLGEAVSNAKVVDQSVDQLLAITGQKPVVTKSKKSISNFKLRENQSIGCKVTLRSNKMYDFLTKFIYIYLPKIRDFRGLPTNSFDGRGNYTVGIKEDSIFHEIPLDKLDKLRGFDITIVTTAETNDEAFHLLEYLGFPFSRKVGSGVTHG